MGRIIPYIMENKKMFETTNQNILQNAKIWVLRDWWDCWF